MRGNLHTHTVYCDGKNTPEEIVRKAVELGFDYIGFSGHSYTEFDTTWCMSCENTERYYNEISYLKKKYDGIINVYCGIERDIYASPDEHKYDYAINSVHYVRIGGKYYDIDDTPEKTNAVIKNYFGGNPYDFVDCYYESVSKISGGIIGHFDLLTKFRDISQLFSEDDARYIKASEDACAELISRGCIFEVNTGAIARGCRKTPYPSERILSFIHKNGGRIILTSDCHDKEKLGFRFDETEAELKKIGFSDCFALPDFKALK